MIKFDFIPGVTDAGAPRAAEGGFPYPGHRTVAEQQEAKRAKWRDRYEAERKSLRRLITARRAG